MRQNGGSRNGEHAQVGMHEWPSPFLDLRIPEGTQEWLFSIPGSPGGSRNEEELGMLHLECCYELSKSDQLGMW